MRSLIRQAVVLSAAIAVICFCSCERHHPGELPVEGEQTSAKPGEHDDTVRDADHHHHESGAAETHATPAEFFPQSTPR
ncbi:MAG: hypothetical protein M3Y03_07405 [Verrucomicrobiota bacterium]|nr:hypothetical protein [Verrucomicrobiota bacterium]